jgi:Protein of unknown function (DUF998)
VAQSAARLRNGLFAALRLMIWAIRYEGYSPISQVPSELTAIGAPTQVLWARLGWIYTVLVAAFGLGLWKSADGNRPYAPRAA